MIELEDLIQGEIWVKDSSHTFDRNATLRYFENKTIVALYSGDNEKSCAIVRNNLLDEYYKTHQTGKVNGNIVDLQLVEVLDYINNNLHIETVASCAGHTLDVDPIVLRGMDRYGNKVDIFEYVSNTKELGSENETRGYIVFKHIPPKPIRDTLRKKLAMNKFSKFQDLPYNGDGYEISWNIEKKQSVIDATCKELTDVILNNL